MRNTGGNKYETTAGEIQFDQFSTFFEKPKMTSRKVTPTAVNVKVKKILTTFSCPLACVGTNLAAICPMEVHLPSEKLVLPYFSSPRGVATSVPFPEVRNRKGTESGLGVSLSTVCLMGPLLVATKWIRDGWGHCEELYLEFTRPQGVLPLHSI